MKKCLKREIQKKMLIFRERLSPQKQTIVRTIKRSKNSLNGATKNASTSLQRTVKCATNRIDFCGETLGYYRYNKDILN